MAQEAFLINPPKRLGRRRRKNFVGETLITIGDNPMRRIRRRSSKNPWYGDPGGHRIAALMRWGKIPRGRINRHRKRGKVVVRRKTHRRRVVYRKRRVVHRRRVVFSMGRRRSVDRRTRSYKISRKRDYGQLKGFLALTSGPKRRFRYTSGSGWVKRRRNAMATRRRRRKRNTWFGQPRRHRKAARKGWRRGHVLGGRSRRRRVRHRNYFDNAPGVVATNPRRRRRHSSKRSYGHRRHRRNPAIMAEFGKFTSGIMNVRDWAPLAVTGGLSAITGAVVPGMIGIGADNPWVRLGVQTAVAIGGGIVVERVVDRRHGQAWMIVGVAMVGYQLLKQFVIVPYFPQFAVGLGAYNDYYPDSAYINRDDVSQQVGAFPTGMQGYPGVGAFENEVGAYPYDGAGY